jgi:hypothetical protein
VLDLGNAANRWNWQILYHTPDSKLNTEIVASMSFSRIVNMFPAHKGWCSRKGE